MAKVVLLLFSAMVCCSVFFSCDDSESNDRTPPQISDLDIPDTILIGADTFNTISANLRDDKELSVYKVYIFPGPGMPKDTVKTGDSISLVRYVKNWPAYGKDTAMVLQKFFILEQYTYTLDSSLKTVTLPVLPGDYILRFACMDIAGNYDSIDTQVKLAYPKKLPQVPPVGQ